MPANAKDTKDTKNTKDTLWITAGCAEYIRETGIIQSSAVLHEAPPDEEIRGFPFLDCAASLPKTFCTAGSCGQFHHIIIEKEQGHISQIDRLHQCQGTQPVLSLAMSGTHFHGQHGRSWAAAPGNLMLCAFFRFDNPPVFIPPPPSSPDLYIDRRISLAECARHDMITAIQRIPCFAVFDTIQGILGARDADRLKIKAPNDIIIENRHTIHDLMHSPLIETNGFENNGIENLGNNPHAHCRKISGCLTQTALECGRLTSVCFGIGVNIQSAPQNVGGGWQTACLQDICNFPISAADIIAIIADKLYTSMRSLHLIDA